MVENLRSVYDKSSKIEANCWAYDHIEDPKAYFSIYIEDNCNHMSVRTWPDTIKLYRSLMKGKKDGS